ncbi:PREDICTED: uncharacterized protein LOC106100271 isoform X2 [Papilio polytes]|uniref:uncharacterized protein LOC106100271 isoform X2 n=1 Tax=Papilio polytes TaxID=76194 RepID=UPI000675DA6B|nr:PREDICTED: uncharacterized protein LOC106100271 isoform X2 [Papilio polytes]
MQVLMSNRWKMNDVEYGERLSSVENSDMKRSRYPLNKKPERHLVTKCTTTQPITTDPNYIPNDKPEANKLTAEDVDSANENGGPKMYKPPPTGSGPDHYIDDA